MNLFKLPETTVVNQIIPKNAFEKFASAKLKKMLSTDVQRITWLNKLSLETINLPADQVIELQIIRIDLKEKNEIPEIVELIQKASPYHILFIIQCAEECYLSTAAKHPHPNDENNAVIDWTFNTDWFLQSENKFILQLKKNLDAIFLDLCIQLSDSFSGSNISISDLIQYQQQTASLKTEISKLKSRISTSKQFNQKVELNLILKEKEKEFEALNSCTSPNLSKQRH